MRARAQGIKSRLFFAVLFILIYSPAIAISVRTNKDFQPVPSDQIENVFNRISDRAYANYTDIKSWQGKLDASISNIHRGTKAENVFNATIGGEGQSPHTIIRQIETTIEFAADFEDGFFYANNYHRKPPRYIDQSNGELLRLMSDDDYEISIGTPDYKMTSRVTAHRNGVISARTATKEQRVSPREGVTRRPDVYDPRTHLISSQPVWELFPLIMQFIEIHGEFSVDGHTLRVGEIKDGSLTEYRIEAPGLVSPGEYLIITMVFSSDNNFNMTSVKYKRPDGQPVRERTWDYEIVDGIYLPRKTTEKNYEDGKLVYQKVCTFVNQNVNQDIPEDTFGYQNLGLENGDRFIDKIADKTFEYKDGELVQLSERSASPTEIPQSVQVSGIVRDPNALPLPGVEFSAPVMRRDSPVSDADGHFSFQMQILPARLGGFRFTAIHREKNLSKEVVFDKESAFLDIVLEPAVWVTAKVVDPAKKPVENARITFVMKHARGGRSSPSRTDSNGVFVSRPLPAVGYHTITLTVQSEQQGLYETELDMDRTIDGDLNLGTIVLPVAPMSVSGLVVNEDGKPLANVQVRAAGPNQPTRMTNTDENGRFILEYFVAGDIYLNLSFRTENGFIRGDAQVQAGDVNVQIMLTDKR